MKKLLSILLSAIILVSAMSVSAIAEDKIMYGDINSDSKINLDDVRLLLQYLAGWDVEIDLAASDTFYDGKVNLTDASKIMQYLADWGRILGDAE